MAYATQETRAVLHFDADCFFCQVECKRRGLDISSIAVCAQQHQDIISVNTKAKEAGVKKHMLPAEARKLLDPINGRVLHVYCEPTCGRVSYAPYRAASRQIIALIRSYLPSKAIVEVASIDELYVALPGTLRDAEALAATIRSAVLQKLGYVMSAGIAGNRLLSKTYHMYLHIQSPQSSLGSTLIAISLLTLIQWYLTCNGSVFKSWAICWSSHKVHVRSFFVGVADQMTLLLWRLGRPRGMAHIHHLLQSIEKLWDRMASWRYCTNVYMSLNTLWSSVLYPC
eukprot:m.135425 g.135425  ORF g.135425 m.135425 type:complete len:284 (-) comp13973_c0_seq11:817-1668(-)